MIQYISIYHPYYSMPDHNGGWKWVPISSMNSHHIKCAIKNQIKSILELETQLDQLLSSEEENNSQIVIAMRKMTLRYNRMESLHRELCKRYKDFELINPLFQ